MANKRCCNTIQITNNFNDFGFNKVRVGAYDLLFQVNSESGSALANASVTINGETQLTNALGQTTFSIAPGTYAYSVTATNYITVNDNVTVTGDQTETVEMLISILRDGSTLAWYDIEALTTITKDGSNRVSDWADKLLSGRDLVQLTGGDQPLYSTNGILFDGISEYMKTAPFVWAAPEMIYFVARQVTWDDADAVFDGDGGGSGALRQHTITPNVAINRGPAFVADNSEWVLGSFSVVRVLINGASSFIRVNGGAATTGDPGATNMAGFTIGARGSNDSWCNVEFKEIICRNIADAAPAQTIIYNYLKDKYGL